MTTVGDAARQVGSRYAAQRLYRTMAMGLAVASLLEYASVLPSMLDGQADFTVPYPVLTSAVIIAPATTILCVFAKARLATLRRVWRVQAIGMLFAYAALLLHFEGRAASLIAQPSWIGELEVIAACAAGLGWRARGTLVYTAALQAVVFANALTVVTAAGRALAIGDAIRQLFYVSLFLCLVAAMLRAGRVLDATVDHAVIEAREAAAAERRRADRSRIGMLIHDHVIVALLAYAAGAGQELSAVQAQSALTAIGTAPTAEDATNGTDLAPVKLAWELQALTTRLDPGIRFEYTTEGAALVPFAAATALAESLGEALRNSLRHAGAEASRQVRAEISSNRINILVLDDGVGFDPDAVGDARLGIRYGIIGRMRAVPGGSARVHSSRGYGTTVALRWLRP